MTLSPRECWVLVLVGRDGKSYKATAHTLGIKDATVRSYVTRILLRYPSPKRPRDALVDLWHSVVNSAVPTSVGYEIGD